MSTTFRNPWLIWEMQIIIKDKIISKKNFKELNNTQAFETSFDDFLSKLHTRKRMWKSYKRTIWNIYKLKMKFKKSNIFNRPVLPKQLTNNPSPYIGINNPPKKLFIGTGSSKSIIKPFIAEKDFLSTSYPANITLKTSLDSKQIKYQADVPAFPKLNSNNLINFIL